LAQVRPALSTGDSLSRTVAGFDTGTFCVLMGDDSQYLIRRTTITILLVDN
jgi:hypothetical protein